MENDDKNRFLEENQERILRLTSRITGRSIDKSDDEWSIALSATSRALDTHSEEKGTFWPYASVVIRNALTDHYRSTARSRSEFPVQPGAFDGDLDDQEGNLSEQLEVQEKASVTYESPLALEIEAVQAELKEYGFSFFDLVASSPKSTKTKASCAKVLRAFFSPPPIVDELIKKKKLPAGELIKRSGEKGKILERHRNYLIAAAVILRTDEYPGLAEYFLSTGVKAGGKLIGPDETGKNTGQEEKR